jgi:CHAT domain-containing protein
VTDLSSAIDDDTHVQITVVHGSVANSDYPLMIGGFEGEQFGGVERFLDRQFGGLLSSWSEIDLYPRKLGSARFIEPSRTADKETEPPGGYVIGLGPMTDLGREELTFGVRQALVDRCMRLYRDPPAELEATARIEVGVSSLLIGVREENGIRIEDSVAGIVEGALQANLSLARYEAAIEDPGYTVRVTALEFIERFAERANLAAVALRRLPTAVQLNEAYVDLRSITVDTRPGGLPLGAVLTEAAPTWRRFLITKVEPKGQVSDRTLLLDVAVLGREARADRVQHRLDRTMVDSLVARVSMNKDDSRTAATLYDQLIPHELRSAFQTTSGVQFVVDATTANYPWELLGAPRPSDQRQAGGSFAGAMRQFTESEERRLNPERASFGSALVIAAANVPGENEIPNVLDEADTVSRLLESALPGKLTLLDDRRREIDLVRVQNELFGDHQVLHIASHGVYTEGQPEATGAILSSECLLTTDMVRQLRFVPDVVFLNCCSLGRSGTNRLAAGLAREFMALGVRALVAAAWPIDDAAARAFAETFYDELIAGRTLGDTVTRARNRCAELGGRETWAAYQCYGDPGFVLRGAKATLSTAVMDPVSRDDLAARLDSLAVQTSDLGRPGRGGVRGRRGRMLTTWSELAEWIDARPSIAKDGRIQRRLAVVARDLG